MNPTPDTSDKELGLDDMVRKFKDYVLEKNGYDELDFKSDLLDWHNHKLEEARIDELARLLNKKDDLIPDWLFKKIKYRIQQLRYYHKSSINNHVIIKENCYE